MTARSDEVEIHRRFRGPPGAGNGGYVAGLLAEWIGGPAEVDLLAPIPLEVPLHRRRQTSRHAMRFGSRRLRSCIAPFGVLEDESCFGNDFPVSPQDGGVDHSAAR